jgi:endonuclease/exonuclease/phosphatase family metal-dependent hydrolase
LDFNPKTTLLPYWHRAANNVNVLFQYRGVNTLHIMCLNGWGGRLYLDLLPYLAASAPDVLCLQEVVHSHSTEKDWLNYLDGDHVLPQRANFFRDVCNALPDYVATFCPAAQGVLWDESISVPSQWGLATFVHKSFPIIGQAQNFVHKAYSPMGYGDHPRSRCAHAVRVYDYERDRAVSITHMHGLRDLNGKMDTPERAAQARRLLDLSRQVSETNDLCIICGDFNVEPNSETLDLLKGAGMAELVTGRNFSGTRNSHYKKPGKFADYMLVNRENEVKDFQVVYDPEVSDHCPLTLKL